MTRTDLVATLAILLCTGAIGAGAIVQAELARPGVQYLADTDGAPMGGLFNLILTLHEVLSVCAIFSLTLLVAAADGRRALSALAVGGMVACLLIAVVSMGQNEKPGTGVYMTARLLGVTGSIFLASLLVRTEKSGGRVFAIPAAVAAAIAITATVVEGTALSDWFAGTWVSVSLAHAGFGGVFAFGLCSALMVWLDATGRRLPNWAILIAFLAILFPLAVMVRASYAVGKMGMPARYIDYPAVFSPWQESISTASWVLTAVLSAIVLLVIGRRCCAPKTDLHVSEAS